MVSLGDIAEDVAAKLVTEFSAPVAEATTITEDEALLAENSLFTKIRFSWRPEDRAFLDRVRVSADAVFQECFADAITIIDGFYASLWVPEVDANGMVRRAADGRPVWQKDENGSPLEKWDQLCGQDIEQALMGLQHVKMQVEPQINKLFLEAIHARTVASDIYDDAWVGVMEGTQGDRTARSNRESRKDRYHAYFRFYLWSVTDSFMKEINQFCRRLEKVRDWQTWGNRR
jgi:hypothetical protein